MGGAARNVWCVVVGAVVFALTLVMGGCERPPAKQLEVAYERQEDAFENGSYTKVYDGLSAASKAMLDADIDMARYGTASQVRSLKPSQLRRVMVMRNRMTKDLIETLTGPELIAWLFRSEVYRGNRERGFEPKSFVVTGDAGAIEITLSRSAQNSLAMRDFIFDERKKTAVPTVTLPWVREGGEGGRGGAWKYDLVAAGVQLDQIIVKQAGEKGQSIGAFLEGVEREREGELKSDWDRAPFKRPGK